jgi:hypothetical protein
MIIQVGSFKTKDKFWKLIYNKTTHQIKYDPLAIMIALNRLMLNYYRITADCIETQVEQDVWRSIAQCHFEEILSLFEHPPPGEFLH